MPHRLTLFAILLSACAKNTEVPKEPEVKPAELTLKTESPTQPSLPPSSSVADQKKPAPSQAPACEATSFALKAEIAEASGATQLHSGELLVVGDSGTKGSYIKISSHDGSQIAKGNFPLDSGASDDLEGLSRIGKTLYGITSSGWIRHWNESTKGYKLTAKAYPLAQRDKRRLVCASAHDSNCDLNYEGMCLRSEATAEDGQCAGFVASKTKGDLICLRLKSNGRLELDDTHRISVATPESLTGCDFAPNGDLWFGTNAFAANRVAIVRNWQKNANAEIVEVGLFGLGFCEALALGQDGSLYRFSDTAGSPSLLSKYECR